MEVEIFGTKLGTQKVTNFGEGYDSNGKANWDKNEEKHLGLILTPH